MRKPYPTLPFPSAPQRIRRARVRRLESLGPHRGRHALRAIRSDQRDQCGQLDVAWTYRTGVGGAFKATPLQIGDTLYVCLAGNIVTALDADTGKRALALRSEAQRLESRIHDDVSRRHLLQGARRRRHECSERILTATTDARLIAVDAKTGAALPRFGANGEVSLLTGMGDVKPGFYYVTSPPTMARGVAVLGGWVADNVETGEPSGVIRGFDALTGELVGRGTSARTRCAARDCPTGRHVHARHTERMERLQRR